MNRLCTARLYGLLGIQKFMMSNMIGEYRFIGLFTSGHYQLDAQQIPLLREKTAKILARANLPTGGRTYRKLIHIINSLPRDDLLPGRVDECMTWCQALLTSDRKRLKLFARLDNYERFVSCSSISLVPNSIALRMKVQDKLTEAFGGQSSG